MGYSAGGACFSTVAEAFPVAASIAVTGVDLSSLRLVGWDASTSKALAVRQSSDGSSTSIQVLTPVCSGTVSKLPVSVSTSSGSVSVSSPSRSYGTDSGFQSLTAQSGYAPYESASVEVVGGFVGLGFATVVGLYWFSYICGQVIDLVRHVR